MQGNFLLSHQGQDTRGPYVELGKKKKSNCNHNSVLDQRGVPEKSDIFYFFFKAGGAKLGVDLWEYRGWKLKEQTKTTQY